MSSAGAPPFFQLEPDERLPREQILDRGRGGLQFNHKPESWRKLTRAELALAVAGPMMMLLAMGLVQSSAPLPIAVVSLTLLILGLAAFAFSGRHHQRPA